MRNRSFLFVLLVLGSILPLGGLGCGDAPAAEARLGIEVDTLWIARGDEADWGRVAVPRVVGRPGLDSLNVAIERAALEYTQRLHASADGVSASVEIHALSDSLASLLFDTHAYHIGAAHGSIWAFAINADPRAGHVLAPADLFAPRSGWANELAELARDDLARQTMRERRVNREEARREVGRRFLRPVRQGQPIMTIRADTLFVHAPPYTAGSFAEGTRHAALPLAQIQAIVRRDGPLAR